MPQAGYLLAASGAIGRNAYDEVEVALELLDTLLPHYASRIEARYKLAGPVHGAAAMPSELLLHAIGRQRGLVRQGGHIHLQKAAEVVLNDFRANAYGRITLETPAQHAGWLADAALAAADKLAQQALK